MNDTPELNGPEKMWVPASSLVAMAMEASKLTTENQRLRDHGLRGDVTIEDVTERLNAELAAAREANAALREALAELLAISEDPELDTGEHCGLERLEQAQAKAREALR